MGPPPRSFAADAHDCIMVGSLRTYRIQGCGAMIPRPMAKRPSDHRPDHNQPVPLCSCLSRRDLETTECAARAERRPTLTGPLCASASTRVGRGEETGYQVEQ